MSVSKNKTLANAEQNARHTGKTDQGIIEPNPSSAGAANAPGDMTSKQRKENHAPAASNESRDEGYGQQSGSYRHKDADDYSSEHNAQHQQQKQPDHNHRFYGAEHPGNGSDQGGLRQHDRSGDETIEPEYSPTNSGSGYGAKRK